MSTAMQEATGADARDWTPCTLALGDLKPNPWNRKKFDEAKLKELAASIEKVGVLQPIVVRRVGAQHEIVAGERRWRAAKIAKLLYIEASVRQLTDLEVVELMAIENGQREDVHPLEEGEHYAWLLKHSNGKYDVPTIAAKVGKSPSYVYQRLKLADLIDPAKKAFSDEKITPAHAILIARLQPGDQKEALASCFDRYGDRALVPVRSLAQFIQRDLHLDLKKAVFDTAAADLVPAAGACLVCPKRSGTNPDLFGDLGKDICTDRRCFNGKVEAHLQKKKAELAGTGATIVAVSTEYGYAGNDEKRLAKAGIVPRHGYHEVPKSDPKAVTAVVVEGPDRGKTMTVRLGKPAPERRAPSASDKRWRKQQEREKARRERDAALRSKVFAALKDKMPTKLDVAVLRQLAQDQADNVMIDGELCQIFGWEIKRKSWNAESKTVEAALAKLGETALIQFLHLLALWSEPTKRLLEVAKKHKVDVKAIEAEMKLQTSAKTKEKAKVKQ